MLGPDLDVSGFENKAFGCRDFAKNNVDENWTSHAFRVRFHDLGWPWDHFSRFALETGLKSDDSDSGGQGAERKQAKASDARFDLQYFLCSIPVWLGLAGSAS